MEKKLSFKKDSSGKPITLFKPKWAPLEKALPKDNCSNFMFMGSYEMEDGTLIHTYKHYGNRAYINLSDDGKAWQYCGDGYVEIDREKAVEDALLWVEEFSR